MFTTTTLSTKTSQSGEKFVATLAEPIVDGDWVIAKKGARVEGVVVDADPGDTVKGVASIAVTLESLTLADGRTVPISASHYRRGEVDQRKDATKIGIATGVGAAIGAIAGGGKGAAIGAGVGGGAGTGVVLATRGDPAVIPAETRVRFTLQSPVTITEQPGVGPVAGVAVQKRFTAEPQTTQRKPLRFQQNFSVLGELCGEELLDRTNNQSAPCSGNGLMRRL